MDPEIVQMVNVLIGFLFPYVIGMEFAIRWEKANTTTLQALGHFMIGVMVGAVIAFVTIDGIFPLIGIC